MARKLRTKAAKDAHARQKATVEPVFDQRDIVQGTKHLLLRGSAAADAEWQLLAVYHNLRKLFVVKGKAKIVPSWERSGAPAW